jgi:pimeloyl-ACP methyl ester carboxylesterase
MLTPAHREAGDRPGIARTIARLVIFFAALVAVLFVPVKQHLRAASVLWRLQSADPKDWMANLGAKAVRVENGTIPAATPIQARFYHPSPAGNAPVMIVLHGVHHLGIEEPRLVAFARAMSSRGFQVITPELQDLADYQVTAATITTIGECARFVRQSSGKPAVIIGLSFAGGLALMAAAQPEWKDDIAMVVAVGAHDNLQRVLEFYATNQIETPSGKIFHLQAHEYGPLVAVYDYPQEFFSKADIPAARVTLKYLLWEDVPRAKAEAVHLSPQGRQLMDLLFAHRIDELAPVILRGIRKYKDELTSVSPSGSMGGLRASVYLLHGAGDNIIPWTESEWLERDLPPARLRKLLISPALIHLDMNGAPSFWDKLKLVHFMSDLLQDAESASVAPGQPAKREPPKASRSLSVPSIAPG